jgi:hypothetical protein
MTIKLPIPNALIGALQSFRAKGAHGDSWQGQRDLEVVYEYIRKYGEACAAAEREALSNPLSDLQIEAIAIENGCAYTGESGSLRNAVRLARAIEAAIRARSKP